jgi:hypothetical protein
MRSCCIWKKWEPRSWLSALINRQTGEAPADANTPKKCRALFQLDPQSLWCKPCLSPPSSDGRILDSPPWSLHLLGSPRQTPSHRLNRHSLCPCPWSLTPWPTCPWCLHHLCSCWPRPPMASPLPSVPTGALDLPPAALHLPLLISRTAINIFLIFPQLTGWDPAPNSVPHNQVVRIALESALSVVFQVLGLTLTPLWKLLFCTLNFVPHGYMSWCLSSSLVNIWPILILISPFKYVDERTTSWFYRNFYQHLFKVFVVLKKIYIYI